MPIPLPPAPAVAKLLTDLVGRPVTTKVVPAARIDPNLQAVASYLGECQTLLAVILCDLPLGGSLGAALMLVPPARVDECVRARRLDEILAENLHEVFNVLSAIFPQHGGPRVILRGWDRGGDAPGDVKAVLAKPGPRLDLEIAVSGYRSGRCAILTS